MDNSIHKNEKARRPLPKAKLLRNNDMLKQAGGISVNHPTPSMQCKTKQECL